MMYSSLLLALNASNNVFPVNSVSKKANNSNFRSYKTPVFSSNNPMSLLFSETNSIDNMLVNPYNLDLSNYKEQNATDNAFAFENGVNTNNNVFAPVQNQFQNPIQMMMQFMALFMQMFMQMMGIQGSNELNTPLQDNGLFNNNGNLGNTDNNGVFNNNPGVPNYIPQGSTAFGNSIAKNAEATANSMSSTGYCYRGVANTLSKSGVNLSGMSAYMGADQLAKSPKFREATVSNNDLKNLPAGAVVVWDKCPGHQHGHISIALGDGREASDHIQNQMTNYGPRFRVFIPVG